MMISRMVFPVLIMGFSLVVFAGTDFNWPPMDEDSISVFESLPRKEYQRHFHAGGTGYLDGVTSQDFSENQAAFVFKDPANRTGIAIRYQILNTLTLKSINNEIYVTTLFQRYRDENNIWASGGHYGYAMLVPNFRLSLTEDKITTTLPQCSKVVENLHRFSLPSLVQLLKTGSVQIGIYTQEEICPVSVTIQLETNPAKEMNKHEL